MTEAATGVVGAGTGAAPPAGGRPAAAAARTELPERKAGRALLAAGSVLPAALLTALADNLLGGGDAASLLYALGLVLALSLPLVVVETLLASMLPTELSLRRSLRLFWGLFQGEQGPARLYALVTEIVVLYLAVRSLAAWFLATFHHAGLIALCITLVLLGLLATAFVLYLPLVSVWRWLLGLVGNPRLHSALLVLSAFIGGLVAWGMRGGLLGPGWDLRPPILLGGMLAFQLGFAALFSVGNRRLSLLVLGLWLSCCLALLPRTLFGLQDEPEAEQVVADQAGLSSRILLAGRTLFDLDGDGFPTLLGGGDCDERNPNIHPNGMDRPGNGIDEDCDGVD